jgi:outer membrane protein OmpA-like peptidoglycan-associated protein
MKLKMLFWSFALFLISFQIYAADSLDFVSTESEITQRLSKPVLKGRGFTSGRGVSENLADDPKVGAIIQFDLDSATIRRESYQLLTEFANAFKNGLNNKKIVIAGHASSDGEAKYNYGLSYRRAQAVRKFLLQQKLPNDAEQRLTVQAFGETQPIDSNETEAGREKNRRVEFIAVGEWSSEP